MRKHENVWDILRVLCFQVSIRLKSWRKYGWNIALDIHIYVYIYMLRYGYINHFVEILRDEVTLISNQININTLIYVRLHAIRKLNARPL